MAHNTAAQGLAALLELGLIIAAIGAVDKFISNRSTRQEFFGFLRFFIRDRALLVVTLAGVAVWVFMYLAAVSMHP
jgi:hypothetical protein